MNMKKFISAASALTIAASAFAGMAVTANAAVDYDTLGSWTERIPNSARMTGNVATVEATETDMAYNQITLTQVDGKNTGVYHGNVFLGPDGNIGSPQIRTTGTRVGTQKLRFKEGSGNVSISAGCLYRSGEDNSGTRGRALSAIATLSYTDDTNTLTVTVGDESDTVAITDGVWYDVSYRAEYTETNANVTVTIVNQDDLKAVSGTTSNVDMINYVVHTDAKSTTVTVDSADETLGTEAPAAEKLTVNYLNTEDNEPLAAASEITLSNVLIGDSYTISYPKYIVVEGQLYTTTETDYAKSIIITEAETSYNVMYTAVEGASDSYFVEGETIASRHDTSSVFNISQLSNGIGGQVGAKEVVAFTAEKSGIYQVSVPVYNRNTRNTAEIGIYKNSKDSEALAKQTITTSYKYAPDNILTASVELNVGDTIVLYDGSTNGCGCIDYVLVTRTGDIAPVPEKPAAVSATGSDVDTGAEDEASLWNATVSTNGYSMQKATATVKLKNEVNGVKEKSESINTTVFSGTATIFVVVNQNVDNIDSVTITVE